MLKYKIPQIVTLTLKSYLLQLAAPFAGKCHLFYYDMWGIKGMRKIIFLFARRL